MTLQDWYYILSITYMLMGIVVFLFVGIIAFMIYRTVKEAPRLLSEKISDTITSIIQRNKSELLGVAAASILPMVMGIIKKTFSRK